MTTTNASLSRPKPEGEAGSDGAAARAGDASGAEAPDGAAPQDGGPTMSEAETGAYCLVRIARHHGVRLSVDRIRHDYALSQRAPEPRLMVRIARENGFTARSTSLSWADLLNAAEAFPAMARLSNGNYVVLSGVRPTEDGPQIVILDPLASRPDFLFLSEAEFTSRWKGEVVLLKRRFALSDEQQPFGLRWFVPEVLRQKSVLRDVAAAAIVMHILGLVFPLFFQIVIDKVLVHASFSTLEVLGAGIVVAILFDGLLTFLRGYMLLHGTSKIDIRTATRTFDHMTRLPVSFFERTTAGVLSKHMQQGNAIREFLTGGLFQTLLDSSVLLVFLPILLFYSVPLTGVVVGFSALLALLIAGMATIFRRRLHALYEAEADRQALLVETIHGMATIKSLALEPSQRKAWDQRSAGSIERHVEVGKISSVARAASDIISKMMSVTVIWVGAILVFRGQMTVGELVAFNMLCGRVSGPLVAIVGLIQQYQQTALSVRMLGSVMNEPPERNLGAGLQLPIKGHVAFDRVTFQYPSASTPALNEVSFAIPPGATVGVVGRSGSGKTTLTKLIQGLHQPRSGLVRVDGVDLREWDAVHLRSHIGVVLQESFLFRGTVRDNIAIARPSATLEEVVVAARTAGAHEFIERLPKGYDTHLEEGATNLSGGQKQRLAIARALVRNPPILVFDEATSALDPDSESIIQENLRHITRGRTTIIVSHRLSSIRSADAIVVMERGKVADIGTHDQLLARCAIYRHLWDKQMQGNR